MRRAHAERDSLEQTEAWAYDKPSNDDISQVVTYAVAKRSDCAILVYPQAVQYRAVGTVGPVRVYALSYPIDGDLEAAGQMFLSRLLKPVGKG
jgi:hypothetical protein